MEQEMKEKGKQEEEQNNQEGEEEKMNSNHLILYGKYLEVSPREAPVGLEGEGGDPGGEGRRGRGARVGGRA